MNLNLKTWHVRWFHFVQGRVGNKSKYANGTTLCHFIRVCYLWGALLVSFWTIIFGVAAWMLCVAPFYGFWVGPIVAAALCMCSVVGYGLATFVGRYGSRISTRLAPVGSVAHCAYEHAKAVKGRFCPIIKFGYGQ